jgi:hypothetical protein
MTLLEQVDECQEFCVAVGLPGTGNCQDIDKGFRLGKQVFRQRVLKQSRTQPFEPPAELFGVTLVNFSGA